MSDSSRFSKYSTKKLPKRNRTRVVRGAREDTNKFYYCQICGFVTNIERDTLNGGEMTSDGLIVEDFVEEVNIREPFTGFDDTIVLDNIEDSKILFHLIDDYSLDGVVKDSHHSLTSKVIGGCPMCGSKNWK